MPDLFRLFDEWVQRQPSDRDPFHPDISEFDLDKYLRASNRVDLSTVEWARIHEHPVTTAEARCLTYMMDIETHTVVFLRDLLATRASFDPEVTEYTASFSISFISVPGAVMITSGHWNSSSLVGRTSRWRGCPPGAKLTLVHDRTDTIRASIHDVQFTLVQDTENPVYKTARDRLNANFNMQRAGRLTQQVFGFRDDIDSSGNFAGKDFSGATDLSSILAADGRFGQCVAAGAAAGATGACPANFRLVSWTIVNVTARRKMAPTMRPVNAARASALWS